MNVPIVLSSNNSYVPYMATTILSVLENSCKDNCYIFYIFHREITKEYQDLLYEQLANYSNSKLNFVNVEHIFKGFEPYTKGISIEAYYRLYIPYYLNDYKKILYLDCDLICNYDINNLFNTDISEHPIAAARGLAEVGMYIKNGMKVNETLVELKNPLNYFNSGVVLINPYLFQKKITFEELLKLSAEREWPSFDQDVLNIIFQDDCLLFPNKWNFIKHPLSNYLDGDLKNDFEIAQKDPCIIHYASGYKPWSNKFYLPYSYDFWKYAMRTPFANIIVDHMNSNYTVYDKEDIPKDINQISMRKLITTILFKFKRRLFG